MYYYVYFAVSLQTNYLYPKAQKAPYIVVLSTPIALYIVTRENLHFPGGRGNIMAQEENKTTATPEG
jgi:hypothetical protein